MTDEAACPRCGIEARQRPAAGPLAGVCPRCLLAEALGSTDVLSTATVVDHGVAVDEAEPLPTIEIGRYGQAVEVGRGGMGAVLRATDPDLRRTVALKILRPDRVGDTRAMARFFREARIAGGLTHPGIPPVHELGWTDDGTLYFAMRLVEGRGLDEVLRHESERPPVEWGATRRRLLDAFVKVCDAVAYAHSRGVVHRDLKPANIMVGPFGEVLVLDWGIARVLGAPDDVDALVDADGRPGQDEGWQTQVGSILGTPAYMSPEQARGERDRVGPASDIYSLGGVLFTLLAHRLPFEGANAMEVISRASLEEVPAPSSAAPEAAIEPELDAVVLRAMARRPADRYPSVEALADDIRAHLEGHALAAASYSPRQLAWKWVRRNRAVSAVALAGLAAVVAVLAIVVPRWLGEQSARLAEQEERLAEQAARERARPHVESGRRLLEHLRLLRREDHEPGELSALAGRAEAEFERALAEVPEEPDALLGIARARALAGDEHGALAFLARTIAALPAYASAYLDRVRIRIADYQLLRHRSDGRTLPETGPAAVLRAELEADLAAADRHALHAWERLYAAGLLAFCGGRFEEAAERLAAYLAAAPGDGWAHAFRGHALVHAGRLVEAEASYERALRCDTRFVAAFLGRGLVRLSRGDLAGAEDDFGRVLELDPDADSALHNRAVARLQAGDAAGAASDLDRLLALRPRSVDDLRLRSAAAAASGDAAGAREALDRALALAPDDPQTLGVRAALRREMGDPEGALEDIGRAIEASPRDAELRFQRGITRRQMGDLEAAIDDWTAAIACDPEHARSFAARGAAHQRLGDPAAARADYDRAIELDPSIHQALVNRAMLRKAGGDGPGAIEDLSRALAAAPDFARAWLERARLLQAGREWRAAIDDWTALLDLEPGLPEALASRGVARHNVGDDAGAAADLRAALGAAGPDWPHRETVEGLLRSLGG